jgi:ABC-type transport system involved in multi-copper enzyme maturation permease subunit
MSGILNISISTLRETIRGKLALALLGFGAVLVSLSGLFASVTMGDSTKVITDFGLFVISLFTSLMAIIAGATLMSKEIQQKTSYNILAKPIARWELLVGKYLGLLLSVTLINFFMASVLTFLTYYISEKVNQFIIQAAVFIFFESAIITALTIFASAILVTPTLVGIFAFCIFVIGHSVEYIPVLISESTNAWLIIILDLAYSVLPHLNQLSISNIASYNLGASSIQFIFALTYSLSYSTILIILGCLAFNRKDLV